jgi:signal transduction histidine kinase
MSRYLAAVVLVADAAVFVAGLHGHQGVFGLVVTLAYIVLAGTAYVAGRSCASWSDLAVVAGAAFAGASVQILHAPAGAPQQVAGLVAFVALPMLVGRYLAQHQRLVRTLDAHNRQLRTEQALLAEREQLRERLRIARDMHDALGRRLSLVSVQAAALEVTELPPAHKAAVTALAGSARDAVTELYQLIGSLRGSGDDIPGAERIPLLVDEFRSAGVTVAVSGDCGPLPPDASHAAYRVAEEGLANAAKHASGQPVSIHLTHETDTLVLTITNPLAAHTAPGGGFGLTGLAERVGAAGGLVDHRVTGDEFRLVAMLPTKSADLEPPRVARTQVAMLGIALAMLLMVLLPASLLAGVG